MKKKKGFTLVELLVVIAIIALLMGILMPALARVRQIAYRMVSGTNQSGIGKAMMIYANDNEGDYPVSGSRDARWMKAASRLQNWDKPLRTEAYGYTVLSDTTNMTVTSCFYLLVKFADVAPKQFVNRSDVGTLEFSLAEDKPTGTTGVVDLTDVWDFGGTKVYPGKYCSYSYHFPFSIPAGRDRKYYPVTQQSSPSKPVVADRNPYCILTAEAASAPHRAPKEQIADPIWDTTNQLFIDKDGKMNATAHQQNGQNVLYNDIHVRFEKLSNCGINNDNIYVPWSAVKSSMTPEKINGFDTKGWPSVTSYESSQDSPTMAPFDEDDSILVSEISR